MATADSKAGSLACATASQAWEACLCGRRRQERRQRQMSAFRTSCSDGLLRIGPPGLL